MHLPREYQIHPDVAGTIPGTIPGTFLYHVSDGNGPSGGWSSIIGIVTAIVGNILISFALNIQRYAHIRLGQERKEQEEKQKLNGRRQNHGRNYNTQQARVGDDRARKNARAEHNQLNVYGARCDDEDVEALETDQLLPSTDSRRSSASDSTMRPDQKRLSTSSSVSSASSSSSSSAREKSYLHSPYWWLGIALMATGEAGNFLAYGFAPASIVSPLGVVALVSNCMIAPLMLHEKFRKRDAFGVLVAVGGCVTVVFSAAGSNPKLGPDAIWELIKRWEFETYLGITVLMIIVLMAGSAKYGDKSILIDLGLVGLFGGYTALSTKGVASLLSNTIWRAVTFPITYVLVFVLVFTAIMQIKYLNRALQRFDSTQVIPTQFVLFTLSVILGSAILYRDFERKTTADAIKFVAGCALTFSGVWLITSGRSRTDDSDDDSSVDEEEGGAINLVDETRRQRGPRDVMADRRASQSERRLHTAQSDVPSLLVTSDETRDGDLTPTLGAPFGHSFGELLPPPGTMSAIHAQSSDALPLQPHESSSKPPKMHATTSAPILPTASSLNPNSSTQRPQTPVRNSYSPGTQTSPSALSPSSRQYLEPVTPRNRVNTLKRGSLADILPGPLATPLSSSLSAIVADSLRKGVDTMPRLQKRHTLSRRNLRRKSAVEESSSQGGRLTRTRTEEPRPQTARLERNIGSQQGRGRSLSTTLTDMFKAHRAQRQEVEEQREAEEAEEAQEAEEQVEEHAAGRA